MARIPIKLRAHREAIAGSPRGPFFAAMLAQARHRLRAAPPEPVSGEC